MSSLAATNFIISLHKMHSIVNIDAIMFCICSIGIFKFNQKMLQKKRKNENKVKIWEKLRENAKMEKKTLKTTTGLIQYS